MCWLWPGQRTPCPEWQVCRPRLGGDWTDARSPSVGIPSNLQTVEQFISSWDNNFSRKCHLSPKKKRFWPFVTGAKFRHKRNSQTSFLFNYPLLKNSILHDILVKWYLFLSKDSFWIYFIYSNLFLIIWVEQVRTNVNYFSLKIFVS